MQITLRVVLIVALAFVCLSIPVSSDPIGPHGTIELIQVVDECAAGRPIHAVETLVLEYGINRNEAVGWRTDNECAEYSDPVENDQNTHTAYF